MITDFYPASQANEINSQLTFKYPNAAKQHRSVTINPTGVIRVLKHADDSKLFVPFVSLWEISLMALLNKNAFQNWKTFVIRIGFKPMTYCLEGNCSIQLSYRTKFGGKDSRNQAF
jgi:hypothetical protein